MTEFQFSYELHTPRWGHTDTYRVRMTRDELTIDGPGPGGAKLRLAENGDPEWSGYNAQNRKNPLMNMLRNDRIFAPVIVPFAIEWAWRRFREGENEAVLRTGLEDLFKWIDETVKAMPKSALWDGAF